METLLHAQRRRLLSQTTMLARATTLAAVGCTSYLTKYETGPKAAIKKEKAVQFIVFITFLLIWH